MRNDGPLPEAEVASNAFPSAECDVLPETGRYEPNQTCALVAGELQRALDDPDSRGGVAQLTARWAAAFVPNLQGGICALALGRERIAGELPERSRVQRAAVARRPGAATSAAGVGSQTATVR